MTVIARSNEGANLPGAAHLVLARLDKVKPAGPDHWYALCPAHEDRSPSLDLRVKGERFLIICRAGCNSTDVLAAIGLAWKDLYPAPDRCARLRPNEGAQAYAKRTLANLDPLDLERTVLRIAAEQIRQGRALTIEDAARVTLAKERIAAWGDA